MAYLYYLSISVCSIWLFLSGFSSFSRTMCAWLAILDVFILLLVTFDTDSHTHNKDFQIVHLKLNSLRKMFISLDNFPSFLFWLSLSVISNYKIVHQIEIPTNNISCRFIVYFGQKQCLCWNVHNDNNQTNMKCIPFFCVCCVFLDCCFFFCSFVFPRVG